MRAHSV